MSRGMLLAFIGSSFALFIVQRFSDDQVGSTLQFISTGFLLLLIALIIIFILLIIALTLRQAK